MVLGLGQDIVSVARIRALLREHPQRFLTRCYRPAEIQEIESHADDEARALATAKRWAAKEAYLKALGGFVKDIPYRDIEIVRGEEPAPVFCLHGRAGTALGHVSQDGILLAMAHSREHAMALVVIQADAKSV